MISFKKRFYKRINLIKKYWLVLIITPFLISYPLYINNYNYKKTYLVETEVDSNEEMIQIYKMIPTYRWSECEVDSINFNKISNYSISLIPMQSSVKISLLSSDAEYGKSFVRKIVDIAHCVYGKSKKNEIEYFKKIENATRAKIDTNKKFLDAVDVIYLNEYLMGIKELHNLKDIKVYLNSQSSQQLSFKTSLHSERMLSYVLIVLLFFLCEFLILLPRIFFCP